MTAKQLLGKEVISALREYRDGRLNSATVRWDKRRALDTVAQAARKRRGYHNMEAIAGRFWFTFAFRAGRTVVEVDTKSYWRPRIKRKLPRGV